MDWEVNQKAVDQATKEVLGLRYRAFVLTHDRLAVNGVYTGIKRGSRGLAHYIFLKPSLSIDQVSMTLWHELIHANQCEDFLRGGILPWEAAEQFKQYYCSFQEAEDRFEWEARVLAYKFAPEHPLVTPLTNL